MKNIYKSMLFLVEGWRKRKQTKIS